jgi:hypothetical protein
MFMEIGMISKEKNANILIYLPRRLFKPDAYAFTSAYSYLC